MTDHRKEVPTWALINAKVIERVIHTDDFARCVREVEEMVRVPPGALKKVFPNSAYNFSLLYCLIVVPKEIWVLSENHGIYTEINREGLLSLFTVELAEEKFGNHPAYYLIQHLRNAVAHARFSIADDGTFTFWDQRNKEKPVNFRASISADALGKFLAKVGHLFGGLRRGPASG